MKLCIVQNWMIKFLFEYHLECEVELTLIWDILLLRKIGLSTQHFLGGTAFECADGTGTCLT